MRLELAEWKKRAKEGVEVEGERYK